MTRPNGIYAIGVGLDGFGAWSGKLLTMQRGEWRPAWTPYDHCPLGCVRECDRREKSIEACRRKGGRR